MRQFGYWTVNIDGAERCCTRGCFALLDGRTRASEAPAPTALRPTFDDVSNFITSFLEQTAPGPVILYFHDIGGPIGMRIATPIPSESQA